MFLPSCLNNNNNNNNNNESDKTGKLLGISKSLIGNEQYSNVYLKINDSIKTWSSNNLGYYKYLGKSKNYQIDSLLCFNKDKNRIITCVLMQQLSKEGVADDIDFLYGEKIKNEWYFFEGANIFVPREMVKDHDVSKPLSYQQLHQIALKEVYGGYLNSKGEINEEWFTRQFEGPGWGSFEDQASSDWFLKGKRFKTRKEYFEFVHLEKAKSVWASRDTTKPIVQLP